MDIIYIILLVLKIIGITLLAIIGLVLFLLLIILFVPVRYKLVANKDTANNVLYAKASVTWLLHLINFHINYDDGKLTTIGRISFIKIYPKKKKDKNNRKNRKRKIRKRKNNKNSANDINEISYDEISEIKSAELISYDDIEDTEDTEDTKSESVNSSIDILQEENNSIDDVQDINKEDSIEEPRKGFTYKIKKLFDRILGHINKIKYIFLNIKKSVKGIANRIIHIKDDLDYYIKFFSDTRVKSIIDYTFSQIRRLLKHICPRLFKLNMAFGFDDPATTGEILAILGVFYPLIKKNVVITPLFEEEIFDFDLKTKGRITLFIVIIIGIKIYFHKNFRRLLRKLKNKEVY